MHQTRKKLVDVTHDEKSHKSCKPFPPDEDLLSGWADLLEYCEYSNECVELCNNSNHPVWTIGNRYGTELHQRGEQYNYKYEQFLLAMGALSDECQTRVRALINECHIPKETLRKICYHVSTFENKDEEKGYVKCFSEMFQ